MYPLWVNRPGCWHGSTGTRLTLNGMYIFEPKLFEGMLLPVGINKENLIGHIIQELGELYPYHQNADLLRTNIALWSQRHLEDWNRMCNALYSEYNPIENYDRNEWEKQHDENSGNDLLTNGGNDVTTNSGTDTTTLGGQDKTIAQDIDDDKNVRTPELTEETSVSSYDVESFQPRDKTVDTGTETDQRNRQLDHTETLEYGKTDTLKHGKIETLQHGHTENTDYGHIFDTERWARMHGNIGVTTTQEMISEEMELRLSYNMYYIITYAFEEEFLVQVY